MALLGTINNPLSNQIIMNAERPNFHETAENFSEFRRKWKEYHRLIKGNSPTTNEGQILHLFQQCLDEETALQLKREIEENPHLTVANFMAFMEKDFGKDFSSQARDELRQVKLTNWGRSLLVKEWRTFKVQWEVEAMRVDDKSEKEEYKCYMINFHHIGKKKWWKKKEPKKNTSIG